MKDAFWITRIFANEFGFSDVRSNYSRVYSWMANQLGHVTLGLGLVLFFYWIVQTTEASLAAYKNYPMVFQVVGGLVAILSVAAALLAFFKPNEVGAKLNKGRDKLRDSQFGPAMASMVGLILAAFLLLANYVAITNEHSVFPAWIAAILMAITICPLIIAVPGLLIVLVRTKVEVKEGAGDYYYRQNRIFRAMIGIVAALGPWALLWHVRHNFAIELEPRFIGAALACSLFGLGVVFLSRDWRFAVLGVLAVYASFALSTGYLGVKVEAEGGELRPPQEIAVGMGVVFAVFGVVCLAVFAPKDADNSYDRWFYAVASTFLGTWFVIGSWNGLDEPWPVAVGGAVASMAIWTIKEFGSDMPNVHDELLSARKQRGSGPSDTGDALDKDYFEAAIWDTRTDAMFCLTGAYIGAGVITEASIITGVWFAGPEMVGMLLALAVFLAGGRNWAYRQQALDKTGGRGNLLAAIECCVTMKAPDGNDVDEARIALKHFAVQSYEHEDLKMHPAEGTPWLDHVVVVGAGGHNDRLANALVSEAVLSSLPPRFLAKLPPEHAWRRARKLSASRLEAYDPENLEIRELPFYPVQDLFYGEAPGGRKPERKVICTRKVGSRTASEDSPDSNVEMAANLVAITRCERKSLVQCLEKLGFSRTQKTAWFFGYDEIPDDTASHDVIATIRQVYGEGAQIGLVRLL